MTHFTVPATITCQVILIRIFYLLPTVTIIVTVTTIMNVGWYHGGYLTTVTITTITTTRRGRTCRRGKSWTRKVRTLRLGLSGVWIVSLAGANPYTKGTINPRKLTPDMIKAISASMKRRGVNSTKEAKKILGKNATKAAIKKKAMEIYMEN